MSELETRVSKMEWTLENHTEEMKEMRAESQDMKMTLHGILQTLTQIKWFAMGVSALYMMDQFGLAQIFKLLA